MMSLNNLFKEYPETKLMFIDKPNNKFWKEWKEYKNCSNKEIDEANLRELFPNEIVIDIDNEDISEYNKIVELLKTNNFNFYSYRTGSRGYHINLYFNNISYFTKEQRTLIRKEFLKSLNLQEEYYHKISEKTILALEDKPHFKTNNIKQLVYFIDGFNVLDSKIITSALQTQEKIKEFEKSVIDIDFKNFHTQDKFFKFISNNVIPEGNQRNNIIFKNIAIALVKEGLNEQQIEELMKPIINTNFPGKTYSEFYGWVKKAATNVLKDYNLTEINNWTEKNINKKIYDLTPLKVKIDKSSETKKFLSDIDLSNMKEFNTEWIVDKWIAKGDINFIAGKTSSFKTTIALHIAYAINNEKLVFNNYKTKKCKILYINEENHLNIFKNIITRVKKGLNIESSSGEIFFSIMENIKIDNMEDIFNIIKFIKENQIDIIFFDSFRRFFISEENDAGAMNSIFNILKYLRKECGNLTIVVLAHAKKDAPGGEYDIRDIIRGSSDIINFSDSTIIIKRKSNQPLLLVEHAKNRSGEELVGKIIKIDSGENNNMFYPYEVAEESDKKNIKSFPEKCAEDIIKYLEDNKITGFGRGEIVEVTKKYTYDIVTKALRELVNDGLLINSCKGKHSKYVFNNPSLQQENS